MLTATTIALELDGLSIGRPSNQVAAACARNGLNTVVNTSQANLLPHNEQPWLALSIHCGCNALLLP